MANKSKPLSNQKSKTLLKELVLVNDDYNTFEHVTDCLEAICDHTPLQAEQCAVLTHLKGRCVVLTGEIDYVEQFRYDLSLYGLNVEIR